MRISVFCLFLTCFIPITPVQAAGEGDTLRQIAKTAKIRIGYREAEPPFSYQLPDGEVTGFSTDLCRAISEDIRTQLKLDKLDIEYVKATPATRFILVRSGKIDIECAATTNNSERRKMVDFSYPNFMTATQFLSRKQDNLKSLADLAGRSVTSASGTVNIEQLNAVNREKNLNISVMPTKTNEEAFELVVAGKASAFVMDGILLAALAATSESRPLRALGRNAERTRTVRPGVSAQRPGLQGGGQRKPAADLHRSHHSRPLRKMVHQTHSAQWHEPEPADDRLLETSL